MTQHNTTRRPLVSVIVSSYNYGRFVGEAIESVQAQTCRDWECIVVDDGSTDDTRSVVGRYEREDGRVRYIYQKNRGPSAARNRGLKESRGRYLQFLDADDKLLPGKLEEQVVYLERHPEVDIVYCDMEYFGPLAAEGWLPAEAPSGDDVLPALVRSNVLGVHAALVRRDTRILFDEELRGPEDWFYWICCAAAGKRFQHQPGRQVLTRSQTGSLSKGLLRMGAHGLRLRLKLSRMLGGELLELNRELTRAAEETLIYMSPGVGDFLRIGLITRQPKWFRYALTARLARLPLVSHIRRLLRRA